MLPEEKQLSGTGGRGGRKETDTLGIKGKVWPGFSSQH